MFLNDFFNLVLVCKDFEPRYGGTKIKGFFYVIHKSFETFIYEIFRVTIFYENLFYENVIQCVI